MKEPMTIEELGEYVRWIRINADSDEFQVRPVPSYKAINAGKTKKYDAKIDKIRNNANRQIVNVLSHYLWTNGEKFTQHTYGSGIKQPPENMMEHGIA